MNIPEWRVHITRHKKFHGNKFLEGCGDCDKYSLAELILEVGELILYQVGGGRSL